MPLALGSNSPVPRCKEVKFACISALLAPRRPSAFTQCRVPSTLPRVAVPIPGPQLSTKKIQCTPLYQPTRARSQRQNTQVCLKWLLSGESPGHFPLTLHLASSTASLPDGPLQAHMLHRACQPRGPGSAAAGFLTY